MVLLLSACGPGPRTSPPPVPTATPTLPPAGDCYWIWATQPLPDVTARLQAALEAVGLSGATGEAFAYGENCIDYQSGAVRGFAAMETDFTFHLPAADVNDLEALGNLAGQILVVLDQFPVGSTPGPQPGQVEIAFTGGGGESRLMFTMERAANVRSRGLTGAALLEALPEGEP